jgi:hypothetical protein
MHHQIRIEKVNNGFIIYPHRNGESLQLDKVKIANNYSSLLLVIKEMMGKLDSENE